MRKIKIKRIYDKAAKADGFRVLVDRIWPRGISKQDAGVDFWAKAIAPSADLRKWFDHDPQKWDTFRKRYRQELDDRSEALEDLVERCGAKTMTLLFAARDRERNQAVVLKAVLEEM